MTQPATTVKGLKEQYALGEISLEQLDDNLGEVIENEPAKAQPDERLKEFLTPRGLVIPNKYFCKYVEEVINKWDTGMMPPVKKKRINGGTFEMSPNREYSKLHMVAEVCGMSPFKLRTIVSGERSSMFRTVDRLFSQLDLTHLWYEDENLALAYSLS